MVKLMSRLLPENLNDDLVLKITIAEFAEIGYAVQAMNQIHQQFIDESISDSLNSQFDELRNKIHKLYRE